MVPVGAPHTFINASDAPVSFFTTFTSAFYIDAQRGEAANLWFNLVLLAASIFVTWGRW